MRGLRKFCARQVYAAIDQGIFERRFDKAANDIAPVFDARA